MLELHEREYMIGAKVDDNAWKVECFPDEDSAKSYLENLKEKQYSTIIVYKKDPKLTNSAIWREIKRLDN